MKVAMIGMGGISGTHRACWKKIKDIEVVAVCDIRKENADAAAEDMGAKAYYSYEEMAKNEKYDILDICLPTYLHAEYAVKALESGVHVICEKPASLKIEDIDRIYNAAEENGKNVMIAQVVRFWKEYLYLKETYESQKYGRLMSGRMTRMGRTPIFSWDDWMRDPERSGLVPFDLHIHDLDFILYAFGNPDSMQRFRAKNEEQDYFEAIYQYPGFFIAAEAAWYDCNYVFQCAFRFQFEHAVLEYKDGKLTVFEQGGTTFCPFEAKNEKGDGYVPVTNAYDDEILYFLDCIKKGVPCDKIKREELKHVLRLIEQLA